ncbi:glutamine-hydrolyzing carbamoyl-phosphate synthase small subunit [Micrococcus endophyticus]|uniref:Carbamoyl phosphate synthase small chain n=1 Tax=Micrococcus endophyticus TaxID=455343 RepID=A0A7W9JHM6_9MICC|nr:glutamine-hydrolyzing carbamoyl-phosphate synthase small subunit [Micrococcus endophyticus]MBB5848046.1 carbamoyl-phosphate synthase small subunit [Micrococcus endophyticus]
MSTPTDDLALLVLEDGTVHRGRAYGARGRTLGEAVFTTGMTGYQETLTDPSYAGQIIVQTSPHIGNTGVNDTDRESRAIFAAGYVVRDAARRPSNWRAERTLDEELEAFGVVGIREVDTRVITRRLRTEGSMRAGVYSGEHAGRPEAELLAEVREQPSMAGARLAETVTTEQPYVIEPAAHGWEGEPLAEIAALDLGIKAATPRHLASRGIRVHVLPATAGLEEIRAVSPDGVFLSNGPGDPATADAQVALLREVLDAGLPFFGICFGNQIFGRALGFDTYKLKFGHRGPNQPVMDNATGRVAITSQNHGFAVDAPLGEPVEAPETRYGRVEVSHWSLNDQVVEGLRLLDRPAFSVQFHPESAAGPNDTLDLFDRFVRMLTEHRDAAAPAATEGA